MKKLCIVSQSPLYSKIGDIAFNLREGDYLVKLLTKSGIEAESYAFSNFDDTVENRLTSSGFEVILTLGAKPTGSFLKLPKSFKLQEYIGKCFALQNKTLVPWYDANHLLIRGKKLEQQTIDLFTKIKGML